MTKKMVSDRAKSQGYIKLSGGIFEILILILLIFANFASAHGDDEQEMKMNENNKVDIQDIINTTALFVIIIAILIIGIFVLIAVFYKQKTKKIKMVLFWGIVIPIVLATFYSVISTIYLNVVSTTKGPVHWHADFEIWACEEMLDLSDPKGISNRVGSPVFHEHNDNRMHVEGVVTKLGDAKLHHFFEFIDGELSRNKLKVVTNNGIVEKNDGQICENGKQGKIQVFVYKTQEKRYTQEKIIDFEDYVISPYSNVPPGDCVIIEFDKEKPKTERICTTYMLAIQRGELIGS